MEVGGKSDAESDAESGVSICFKFKGIAVNITMPDSDLNTDLRLTLKFSNIPGEG